MIIKIKWLLNIGIKFRLEIQPQKNTVIESPVKKQKNTIESLRLVKTEHLNTKMEKPTGKEINSKE